jgi:hypothetical protein
MISGIELAENDSLLNQINRDFYESGFRGELKVTENSICYINTILHEDGQVGHDRMLLRLNETTLNGEVIAHFEWIQTFPAGNGKGIRLFDLTLKLLADVSKNFQQDIKLFIEFKQSAIGFYNSKSMQKYLPFMERVCESPFNSDRCRGCYMYFAQGCLLAVE